MYVVVVVVRNSPIWVLGVVDDELYIFGDGCRLDGREIGAFDDGIGVCVAHLDGPGAGTTANVQDMSEVGQGSIVEATLEELIEETVLEIKAVGFGRIVWEVVCCWGNIREEQKNKDGQHTASSIAMISATIFLVKGPHAVGQGLSGNATHLSVLLDCGTVGPPNHVAQGVMKVLEAAERTVGSEQLGTHPSSAEFSSSVVETD